jgi:glycosyltransferase involved in cell wall biosynthesis
MNRPGLLKWLFYLCLTVVVLLVGYKVYLNLFMQDFNALHTEQAERISDALANDQPLRFAVVGNINNSIGIFEERIVPALNAAEYDFMVSAGNAVSGGGEDKYRALFGSLGHLNIPWLMTFGDNEYNNFGSFRFYDHFGPHFYSVRAGVGRLIFLDSTGKTAWQWQLRWLDELLAEDTSKARIIFMGDPLLHPSQSAPFDQSDDYLQPPEFRQALLAMVKKYDVNAVISANLSLYDEQIIDDTLFITTGGAGGLVMNDEISFYHYLTLQIDTDGNVSHTLQRLEVGQHPLLKKLESLWFFIYSLFYTGYLNFFLLVAVFSAVTIKLYGLIFVGKDYYPDYDLDASPFLQKPIRVAMFTNNYLPFIGGVPISIARLRRGLEAVGDSVLVVAPRYKSQPAKEESILRVPALLTMGSKREFRLANIFLSRIRKRLRAFKPDLIHLHHPFWLGSLGLFLARRLNIPAVYTYHTRLEHYAHFVPLPGMLFRNLISHALIKRFANKCDTVIVPTYSIEEYLRMIGVKTPVYVQPTGIEYERFRAVNPADVQKLRKRLGLKNEKVLVSVSRLSNEKNIDFMIDGLNELRRKTAVAFHFVMIGEGHQRERLQQKIDDLGLQQHITLAGSIEPAAMATWYQLGDIFVFASKSETQGMVILEAMAAGLPVVAVRSSGIDDVVRQGVNGFKTPDKQSLWCERVQQLLEQDDLRQQLAEQALDFARDYSVEQFARDVRRIYGETLAMAAKKARPEKP